ncbi:DUF6477 family protein [Paracoccus sp. PAR01]|uniref:DUF6477 family protein n=1 Tax=Paracoccus sp. PAR01 TaxID=2769282 RepID=UPI00177C07C3|nr:DUF6477 family protein [Paracoccus sp. PAR01]MBD9529708.1 hypothetical protein [Paracoccus sp. PAR01]
MTMMPNVIQFQPRPQQTALRRPRLLVRAARIGAASFNRKRELPRLLKCDEVPSPEAALARLRAEEAQLNAARLDAQADYDLQRHVLVMIAILAEMALLVPAAVTYPGTAIPARP